MEVFDGIGKVLHQLTGQTPLARHLVQQRGLVEPAHHKQPIDGFTSSAELKALSAGADGYGHNRQIKLRRRPGIYFELSFDDRPAFFEGREIEIRKLDRTF